MAIATDGCNVIGRLNFLAQKLEAKSVSLVTVYCHPHRPALASYYTAAELYNIVRMELQKYFNAIMEVCFDVAIGWPGDASNYNEDKRLAVAVRVQNMVVVEWGNSECLVWDFGYLRRTEAAVRKYKWCNVRSFTATYENKIFQHAAFLLSTLALHLTEPSKVFQAGCFNFAQMKASVELCINKLSDAAAKSEPKANCKKFDSEFGDLRTSDGLAECVKWHGVLSGHRKIGKLAIPVNKKGDMSEWITAAASLCTVAQEKCMPRCRENN